jgi:hypothetical protein
MWLGVEGELTIRPQWQAFTNYVPIARIAPISQPYSTISTKGSTAELSREPL